MSEVAEVTGRCGPAQSGSTHARGHARAPVVGKCWYEIRPGRFQIRRGSVGNVGDRALRWRNAAIGATKSRSAVRFHLPRCGASGMVFLAQCGGLTPKAD